MVTGVQQCQPKWAIIPFSILVFWSGSSLSQSSSSTWESLSLEELLEIRVVTATKKQQTVNEVPATISVIHERDIAQYGFRTIAEALTHIPGFVDLFDGNNHNFGVRGSHAGNRAASRLIKVMVNGIPIGFRSNQNRWLGLESIAVETVERIEVVRGPVSALYGADALMGAINIITKKTHENHLVTVEYEFGDDDRRLIRTGLTGGFSIHENDWVYSIQLSDIDRSGLKIPEVSPDFDLLSQTTSPKTESRPVSVLVGGQYQWDNHQFSTQWIRQEKDLDHVFSDRNSLTGRPTHIHLINQNFNINWNVVLDSQHELRSRLIYSHGDTGTNDRLETGASDVFFERQLGYSSITLNTEWFWNDKNNNQDFLIGLEWDDDEETIESFTRVNEQTLSRFQLTPRRTKDFINRALFIQWQKQLSDFWRMILGARVDDHSIYSAQESFRFGLIQTLDERWQIKWLVGSSFQSPSPELLFRTAVQPGDVIGNPDLEPQRLTTVEAQLNGVLDDGWQTNISVFYNEINDLVTYQQEFFNRVARNTQESSDRGIELEIKRTGFNWNAFINMSYVDIERKDNPLTLVPLFQRKDGELMPKLSASIGVSKRFYNDQINISIINTFHDKRPASTENVLLANQDYALDSFWSTAINARWRIDESQHVQFKVRDLFDNKGVNPGFGGIDFPTDGRRMAITYWRSF